MLGLCENFCIVLWNIELFLITFQFFITEFRLFCFDLFNPLIVDHDRYKIRFREITIILSIFFGTHCVR